ncbi:uncharacterized protein [Antedon mediterranea]
MNDNDVKDATKKQTNKKDKQTNKKDKQSKKKSSKQDKINSNKQTENVIKLDDGDNNEKQERKRQFSEEITKDKSKTKAKSKKRKKKIKEKHDDSSDVDKTNDRKAQTLALQYLQQWKKFKNVWSFQKVRQVWLLRNMYDTDMVDDDYFEILLEYIEPLKGLAKITTLEKAEKLLKEQEESESEDESPQQDEEEDGDKRVKLTDKQMDRVRQVIQILV